MLRPTPDEIAAARSLCREKFGHERIIGIELREPIDAFVIMAAMGMREASEYADARAESVTQARSALVARRALWPSQKVLSETRRTLGALDAQIENYFRTAHGWTDATATALPFSVAAAPPGFAAPEDLAAKADELQRAHPAAKLWSITQAANGLSLVVAAAEEDVYGAAVSSYAAAQQSKRGVEAVILTFMRDLIVWSPKPIDALLEEKPGRAADLANPFFEMGGAGASGSVTFL
jgi:hypothetical protein